MSIILPPAAPSVNAVRPFGFGVVSAPVAVCYLGDPPAGTEWRRWPLSGPSDADAAWMAEQVAKAAEAASDAASYWAEYALDARLAEMDRDAANDDRCEIDVAGLGYRWIG